MASVQVTPDLPFGGGMGNKVMRGMAAAGTVVIAAAVNVTTGILTQHWAVAWWMTTVVLVAVGAGAQVWLTLADRGAPGLSAAATVRDAGAVTGSGDVPGIASPDQGPTYIHQTAEVSGDSQVYQAGRDQIINDLQR
jgi:hypothetical protein